RASSSGAISDGARDVPHHALCGIRSTAMTAGFGLATLPTGPAEALRRAIRREWVTIGVITVTVTRVYLVRRECTATHQIAADVVIVLVPELPDAVLDEVGELSR